jgi:hypothetical protein
MAEEISYCPKDVSDPKSPRWRHRCNAKRVPIAGTAVGIQGCQWINCCVNQIIAFVNYKQKRGQDHHALIKETVDLWRSVCDGNQERSTWFRTEIETMVEQFIITEDDNILLLMQSTIKYCLSLLDDNEHNDIQLPGGMYPDTEIAASLAALQHFKREAKHTVIRWCDEQPPGTMCSMNTIFGLLLDNIHADVSDGYWHTLRLWSNEVWDRAMLKCSEISYLYSNTRGAKEGRRKVEEWHNSDARTTCNMNESPSPSHDKPQVVQVTVWKRA